MYGQVLEFYWQMRDLQVLIAILWILGIRSVHWELSFIFVRNIIRGYYIKSILSQYANHFLISIAQKLVIRVWRICFMRKLALLLKLPRNDGAFVNPTTSEDKSCSLILSLFNIKNVTYCDMQISADMQMRALNLDKI